MTETNLSSHQLARDLAALIGSRICHDLISPVGAIANGVELLAMAGTSVGPEISLISESVDNANARVKFFRVAFGAASPGQTTGRSEMVAILKALDGGRMSYAWEVEGDHLRAEVKLATLLILCAETALPRGGHIRVTHSASQWHIVATADKMNVDAALFDRLAAVSLPDGLRANDIQFLLAPLQAEVLSRHIRVSASATELSLSF
ncbi:hypothetical protein AQS8620_01575 [Aquimixticola soesokkakensis]|uniref:Histidine phosphotransferase ChpT C-terminal domain-containing protein n=1 Tax=Aquimixticola soesokkakensis TaxID=1519096 RepID=A0A1Y5SI05_9RHOB|nr:histidine phosphotransferase family protein [Aquimixticola soesokkakensis]SLN41152.1 hypothetical protein AQS8620_01575 [Aquimixticola soesokkakensis]